MIQPFLQSCAPIVPKHPFNGPPRCHAIANFRCLFVSIFQRSLSRAKTLEKRLVSDEVAFGNLINQIEKVCAGLCGFRHLRQKSVIGQIVKLDRAKSFLDLVQVEFDLCGRTAATKLFRKVAKITYRGEWDAASDDIGHGDEVYDDIRSAGNGAPLLACGNSRRGRYCQHRGNGLCPRCPLALRHAEALDEPAAVIDWIRHATSPVLNGAIVCGGMV